MSLMRIFAWIVVRMLGLTVVFALLIVAAQAIGNAQPPPAAIQELHLTDCQLPCWLGITPGRTSFDEVVQRLKVAYPESSLDIDGLGILSHSGDDSSGASVSVSANQARIVSTIDLITSD